MSSSERRRWDNKYQNPKMQASNIAWSNTFKTIGCITGDNTYWCGSNYEDLLDDPHTIHWHPVSLSHIFATKSFALEPNEGGKIAASSVRVLVPRKKPLIKNWDFIEPYENRELIDSAPFLQEIILLQEKEIDTLMEETKKWKDRYCTLLNVCDTNK